jgi:hypothetical protein
MPAETAMKMETESVGGTHSALDDCLGANENHVDPLHVVRVGTVEHDGARDPSGGEDLMCAHAAARESRIPGDFQACSCALTQGNPAEPLIVKSAMTTTLR